MDRHSDPTVLRWLHAVRKGASTGTVGADKGYDTARFVDEVRALEVTPHIAQKIRYSARDGRITRHPGYQVSQRKRKLVEQVFGWLKTVGGLRKLRHLDGAAGRSERQP